MAMVGNFRDFLEEKFDNELSDAVASYVSEDIDRLERTTRRVADPDEAELVDFHIKSVSVRDEGGIHISFAVLAEAEFAISETHSRDPEPDSVIQWFRLACSGDLDEGFHNFAISSVEVYTGSRSPQDVAMSGDLVPYISKERLEAVAEDFLRRIYPEALERPMPLPVLDVASRMGLSVQPERLTKNMTVFGQMCFADCEVECYDHDQNQYVAKLVAQKTILYDPDVFMLRNVGCVNNTIIHECVHWDKHKKAFELQKLCNESLCTIRCRVVEGTKPDKRSSTTEWMEWQARALAPRILMPYKQAGIKAKELIAEYKKQMNTDSVAEVIEPVILAMKDFFNVSIASAKIRMVDLGYEEAMGVFEYSGNRYVPAHSFAKGAIQQKQTFTITMQDALFEYATNMDLRRILDSGKYLYVDSHYCLNSPRYIQYNEQGNAELTDYANSHIDECCLVFDLGASKNKEYGKQYYTECILYKHAASQYNVEAKFKHNAQNDKVEQTAATIFSDEIKETKAMYDKLPSCFSEALIMLMKWRGISERELADACLVDEKTIQRMRTGKSTALRSIIAVCVGLQLPPTISTELVRKAGHTLVGDTDRIALSHILSCYYKNSIYECNELMEAADLQPLSGASK